MVSTASILLFYSFQTLLSLTLASEAQEEAFTKSIPHSTFSSVFISYNYLLKYSWLPDVFRLKGSVRLENVVVFS